MADPRINQPPLSEEQQEEDESISSPLGLNLRKSPSLVDLISSLIGDDGRSNSVPPPVNDSLVCMPMTEKLKASNIPARRLIIGYWKREAENEGDLVAKVYFGKKKLVWEMLEYGLKFKIEMSWTDISAIRPVYGKEIETLEVELSQIPMFYKEINPRPRKHSVFESVIDFTNKQATSCRIHYIEFTAGSLQKHYEKLLYCDRRLQQISQQGFPSQPTYFRNTDVEMQNLPPKFSMQRSRFEPIYNQPLRNWCPSQFPGISNPRALATNQLMGHFAPRGSAIQAHIPVTNQLMGHFAPRGSAIQAHIPVSYLEPNMGKYYNSALMEHATTADAHPIHWYNDEENINNTSLLADNAGMNIVLNENTSVSGMDVENMALPEKNGALDHRLQQISRQFPGISNRQALATNRLMRGFVPRGLADNARMNVALNENTSVSGMDVENMALPEKIGALDHRLNVVSSPAPNFNPPRVSADHYTADPERISQNRMNLQPVEDHLLSDSNMISSFQDHRIVAEVESYRSLINLPENLGSQEQISDFDGAHYHHMD